MHTWSDGWRITVVVLAFLGVALGQSTQQKITLVVNGQRGDATVVQINGRSYIDLETLARIANGSVTFQGTQVILTIPSSSADKALAAPVGGQVGDSALSTDFMRAAVQNLDYSLSPNALNDDQLYQRILHCSQFLGTMLASGTFEDDRSSCH